MNLPWDKYEYSDPFLVQVDFCEVRYFMWRRNNRTGQFKLRSAGRTIVTDYTAAQHMAPNPLECFPPLVAKE